MQPFFLYWLGMQAAHILNIYDVSNIWHIPLLLRVCIISVKNFPALCFLYVACQSKGICFDYQEVDAGHFFWSLYWDEVLQPLMKCDMKVHVQEK